MWQRICATPIHRDFPFALSHAALLLFFFFIYLSQLQDPNSISANTTVVCDGCQIQGNRTTEVGRLHWYQYCDEDA